MKKVFVSYKFRDSDRQIASDVKRLIRSHSLTAEDGEDLGGNSVYAEVSQRISGCDALIALFLPPVDDQSFYQWLTTEYTQACLQNRRAIAVVEQTVHWVNPQNREYVRFDFAHPLDAFLKLSTTLGLWRQESGRRILIRLEPELAARLAKDESYGCFYRLTEDFQPITGWIPVKPGAGQLGIGFPAAGIRENVNIEIEVRDGTRQIYHSAADPNCIAAELKPLKKE